VVEVDATVVIDADALQDAQHLVRGLAGDVEQQHVTPWLHRSVTEQHDVRHAHVIGAEREDQVALAGRRRSAGSGAALPRRSASVRRAGRQPMTTTTSPAPTVSPAVTLISLTVPASRRDLVLHHSAPRARRFA
jgi:hypothetical protein